MSDNLKILGQISLAANTETELYVVPAAAQTTISSLVVCNRHASSADTFRVKIKVKNASDDNKQFIYYDKSVNAKDTLAAVIGITLSESDVIEVYATNGTLSFNLFGVETT